MLALVVWGLSLGAKKIIEPKTAEDSKIEEAVTPEHVIDEAEVEELEFTQEQLEQYYAVYQNPYVVHLREALNGYLNGTNQGIESPELVLPQQKINDANAGLESFSKDYYQSKFIVFAVNSSIAGGKEIAIIFQDKPDKLFNAWVYQLADNTYDLRGFGKNKTFTPDKMVVISKQYARLLNDKEHAL